MAVSAQQVKELRDKTGAGMIDCKKALEDSNGDLEVAIDILRKKGAAVAAKRAERAANEGVVLTKIFDDGKSAVMIEVNCETDFVAKNEDFASFANLALEAVITNQPADVEALMTLSVNGKNLSDELNSLIGKIGEKIQVSRFTIEKADNGVIVDYIHHGSKLGVLISAENIQGDKAAEFTPILKDFAMQVAAMRPISVYREEVDKTLIEKEMEIYKELARKEGKPEQILEKIAAGKLNKYYEENCLFEQAFVKDNSKKVSTLIEEFNQKHATKAKLIQFKRFHLSDEKK
ncbi:MAG: translation elongation factor T [Ignavibacteria bacterium]|nr:MAG: translation elongation factor T [Ignavibacteria bacterium]KAF0161289.1 MAG: translation elongation factor T [Ignavibacteria bacterium]